MTTTKTIELTQGKFAQVDDEDFERLNQYNWYFNCGYAMRHLYDPITQKTTKMRMHREIMKAPKGIDVDHINGNRLDNRRENLRLDPDRKNTQNQGLSKNSTSGYKGVSWSKASSCWVARIKVKNKKIHLGLFDTLTDAAKAYDKAALELHGEFSKTNFPESSNGK